MTKAFSLLTTALLGAAVIGVTAVSAQTTASPGSKCGPEVFSSASMTYVAVPCNGEGTAVAAPAAASGQTAQAASAPCKPEAFSSATMNYVAMPCSAGTTYENPGYKGPKQ